MAHTQSAAFECITEKNAYTPNCLPMANEIWQWVWVLLIYMHFCGRALTAELISIHTQLQGVAVLELQSPHQLLHCRTATNKVKFNIRCSVLCWVVIENDWFTIWNTTSLQLIMNRPVLHEFKRATYATRGVQPMVATLQLLSLKLL